MPPGTAAPRMVAAGVLLSFAARVTRHSTLSRAARYGKHAPTNAGRQAIRALEAATRMAGAETVDAAALGTTGSETLPVECLPRA